MAGPGVTPAAPGGDGVGVNSSNSYGSRDQDGRLVSFLRPVTLTVCTLYHTDNHAMSVTAILVRAGVGGCLVDGESSNNFSDSTDSYIIVLVDEEKCYVISIFPLSSVAVEHSA